jgi:hypothetical protein
LFLLHPSSFLFLSFFGGHQLRRPSELDALTGPYFNDATLGIKRDGYSAAVNGLFEMNKAPQIADILLRFSISIM